MGDAAVVVKLWVKALGYWTVIALSFVAFVAAFKFVWGLL